MAYEKDEEQRYGQNTAGSVDHVWHEDESTMWQKDPAEERGRYDTEGYAFDEEAHRGNGGPSHGKPPKKRCPWKTLW